MAYFKNFPKLLYSTSLGVKNFKLVPNILAKVAYVKDILNNSDLYYKYDLQDGEKPEDVAYKFYDDPGKHWIILLANQVVDPYYDWILPQNAFKEFILKKYSSYNLHLDPTETYNTLSLGQLVTVSAALGQPINQPSISQVGRYKIGNGVGSNDLMDDGPGNIMTIDDPYNVYHAGMIFTYAGISGSYWPNLVNIENGGSAFDPASTFATYPSICRLVELVSTGPGGIGNKWRIDKTTYLKKLAQSGDEEYPSYWHLLWQRYPIPIDDYTGLSIIRYSATGLPYDGIYSADGNFDRLLWNAGGWSNLDQISQRIYVSWQTLIGFANPLTLGYYLIAKDTVTNSYYKIRFTEWSTETPNVDLYSGLTYEDWIHAGLFGCTVQKIISGGSEYVKSEIVFQGSSIDKSSAEAKVVSYDGENKILTVNFLTDVFANNTYISGATSNNPHKIIGITCNNDGIEWSSNTISHYAVTEVRWNSYDLIKTTEKYIVSFKDYNTTTGSITDRTVTSDIIQLNNNTNLFIERDFSPVYYYNYENDLNEEKRSINVPKPEYSTVIEQQFNKIMSQ